MTDFQSTRVFASAKPTVLVETAGVSSAKGVRWFALAWATIVVVSLVLAPLKAEQAQESSDFVSVYTAASMVHAGDGSNLYVPDAQASAQAAVLGHPLYSGLNVYRNPPIVAWALQPLALLPLPTALLLFEMASLLCVAVAVWLLVPLVSMREAGTMRGVVALDTAVLLPLSTSIAFGNWGGFIFLAAVLALRRLRRSGDSLVGGLVLGLGGIKPQDVWLVLPALLAARTWRTAFGFVAAGAGWLVTFPLVTGLSGFRDWVGMLGWFPGEVARTDGLPAILASWGVPLALSALLPVIGCLGVSLVVAVNRRWRLDAVGAVALGISVSAVASPHVYVGDIAIGFGLALFLLARDRLLPALAIAIVLGCSSVLLPAGGRWFDAGGCLLLGAAAVAVYSRTPGLLHSDLT